MLSPQNQQNYIKLRSKLCLAFTLGGTIKSLML